MTDDREFSVSMVGPTRIGIKCKIRREGRFVVGGILGLPATFAGLLVGERRGQRLLFRGTVEWGLGMRTAKDLLRRGCNRATSPVDASVGSSHVTLLRTSLQLT